MKKAQKRLIPGVPHPLEASKLKYSIKGRFEPFPWPKVNQNAVKRLSYYIFMIHLCQRCLLGAILGHFRAKNGQILPVLHPISYQNLSGGLRLAHLVLNKIHSVKVITLSPSRYFSGLKIVKF